MPNVKDDYIGRRFGDLLVLGWGDPDVTGDGRRRLTHSCRCDCGSVSDISRDHLACGHTTGCRECRYDRVGKSNRTHGLTLRDDRHPLWATWSQMKSRCYNKEHRDYPNWGGRGVVVCDRWRDSFQNFVEDMGERPHGYSMDRIDNSGPYSPENCRWASPREQAQNTRRNRIIDYDGRSFCVAEWNRQLNYPKGLLEKRLRRSWSIERAMTTPPRNAA